MLPSENLYFPGFHRPFGNNNHPFIRRFPFEDIATATRTLFVGNLEAYMNETEIRS